MAPLGAAPFGDHGGAISGFLVWLRLWLACWTHGWTEDNRHKKYFQGGKRAPSLLPASARAASAPCLRANRQARRITARGLPASRQYAALNHLNGRRLTIGQFMERACRLSANGRTEIYRLRGRKRLCQCREAFTATGSKSGTAHQNHITTDGLSLGLCAAHIWPN